jgi:hypothetical protein
MHARQNMLHFSGNLQEYKIKTQQSHFSAKIALANNGANIFNSTKEVTFL